MWKSAMQAWLGDDNAADERGTVLVLVALMIVVIFGFTATATDVGVLYIQKQHGQAAADAGALAGADVLLQGATTAASMAHQYAQQNTPSWSYTATANSGQMTVQVSGQRAVPLWFARVFGISSTTEHAASQAVLGALSAGTGMVPIAVPNQTFVYGQSYILSDGAGDGQSGNFGFLDFSGNGANGLEYDIEHGYNFPLNVGEQVATKPGVMAGPVENAITYRMTEADSVPGCASYEGVSASCPRVLYLPVIDSLDVSGKKDVTILGFAAFYLDGIQGSGGNQQITGRFVRIVRPGTVGFGTDYGTYGVRLTDLSS